MPLLDTELVRERRIAQGLSQPALARQLGASTPTISRLESGDNHDTLTLGFVNRLGEALGMLPHELLARPADSADPQPDDVKLEAALALIGKKIDPADLARALGWRLDRVKKAAHALRKRRAATGQRLTYGTGRWGLQPALRALTRTEITSLERACLERAGISIRDARVLRDVVEGKVDATWLKHASEDQRIGLARLLRLGWVRSTEQGHAVTDEVAMSLGTSRGKATARAPDQPNGHEQRGLRDPSV